jgi:hypothetical protein
VAVRHVISDQQQIEVLYLKGGAHNHQIERFNASNYQSSGLAQLDVATSFLPLLT